MTADELTRSGIEAYTNNQHTEAVQLFQQAVADDPEQQVALLWLAVMSDDPAERQQLLMRAAVANRDTPAGQQAIIRMGNRAPEWLRDSLKYATENLPDYDGNMLLPDLAPTLTPLDPLPQPRPNPRRGKEMRKQAPAMWVGMLAYVTVFVVVIVCMIITIIMFSADVIHNRQPGVPEPLPPGTSSWVLPTVPDEAPAWVAFPVPLADDDDHRTA